MIEEKNFLKKCPQVESNSDEWKVIEFKMQLSLGTTAVNVKKIYNISNTHVSSSFSSYAKGSIVLESFIETQKLTENNKLQKICQKGFDIGENGMIFNVGYNRNLDIKAQRTFSFVMCKMAIGKAYCYAGYKYRQKAIQCPEGFDTIYLYNQEENPQVFLHRYVMFKNYQIYPNYLIDFTIDSYKQKQLKSPECENCIKSPPNQAKIYCKTEEAAFCYDCDQEYHSTRLGLKHEKVDISEKPKNFGFCNKHESNRLQLYCSVCYEALCINCKINGDHSVGQMGNHKLLKLREAYSDISLKVKQIDPNIERRKNQLTEDLSNIDLKIKEVNTKATHVQEQIYAQFHKALNQLHKQTQKKLSFLIGDQLELKRQYDHIQWLQSFLRYSLEVQEPHEFLKSWYKYSKYKKEVLSLSNLAINTEVKADMKLEGTIYIICEQKTKKELNANANRPTTPMNVSTFAETPAKNQKTPDKEIGSTHLRKTVFKKHYSQKSKNFGNEPNYAKGSYDVRIPNGARQQSPGSKY